MLNEIEIEGSPIGDGGAVYEDVTQVRVLGSGEAEHRCVHCSFELDETAGVWMARDAGPWTMECQDNPPEGESSDFGPHVPGPNPLAWMKHARVTLDPERDQVRVTIGTSDPRGGFTLMIGRVSMPGDEHDGRLIMTLPFPGGPSLHEPLTEVAPGRFLVGDPEPYLD